MDYATEERHAPIRQLLQQHTATGAPCTQLVAVSDGSAGPNAQPQPQGAGAADQDRAAGQAEEGTRRKGKRAFRFRCNNPACSNTEESLQRRLNKCGRCRGVR